MITLRTSGLERIARELLRVEAVLSDFSVPLLEATEVLYRYEAERFDTFAMGQWPALKAATIAEKERRGYPRPESPLFATGHLEASATSPTGPWSGRMVSPHQAEVWVDWDRGGWQIPVVLSEGDEARGLPARPIYDANEELAGLIGVAFERSVERELALA